MLQIGKYENNYLIINILLRLGTEAGINSLPFAIFARKAMNNEPTRSFWNFMLQIKS